MLNVILIAVAQASQLDEAIAQSTLIIYPDLGHVPQEEDPLTTLKDARDFLER